MSIKDLPAVYQLADFYITKSQRYSRIATLRRQEGELTAFKKATALSRFYKQKVDVLLA